MKNSPAYCSLFSPFRISQIMIIQASEYFCQKAGNCYNFSFYPKILLRDFAEYLWTLRTGLPSSSKQSLSKPSQYWHRRALKSDHLSFSPPVRVSLSSVIPSGFVKTKAAIKDFSRFTSLAWQQIRRSWRRFSLLKFKWGGKTAKGGSFLKKLPPFDIEI